MNRRVFTLSLATLMLAAASASGQRLHFDGGGGKSFELDAERNQREINRLLDQQRDMEFSNATLDDVVAFLEAAGIGVFVDQRALDDVGFDPSHEFNFRQRSIRVGDGLRLLLQQLDLTHLVRNGRLVISTPDEAESHLNTKTYDVRHLVELVPTPQWNWHGQSTTQTYQYDFDSLIQVISSSVEPQTWDEVGGPGSIKAYWTRRMRILVISQTDEVHEKVEALMIKLARHGGTSPLPGAPAFMPRQQTAQVATEAAQPTFAARSSPRGIRSSQLRMTGQ